jgi:hypothetical protein
MIIKKSSLLHENPIATHPQHYDTKIFRPIKKSITKAILGLSPHKKLYFFLARARPLTIHEKATTFYPRHYKYFLHRTAIPYPA